MAISGKLRKRLCERASGADFRTDSRTRQPDSGGRQRHRAGRAGAGGAGRQQRRAGIGKSAQPADSGGAPKRAAAFVRERGAGTVGGATGRCETRPSRRAKSRSRLEAPRSLARCRCRIGGRSGARQKRFGQRPRHIAGCTGRSTFRQSAGTGATRRGGQRRAFGAAARRVGGGQPV